MMSGMRLKDILQEFVPSELLLSIPFLVIWEIVVDCWWQ